MYCPAGLFFQPCQTLGYEITGGYEATWHPFKWVYEIKVINTKHELFYGSLICASYAVKQLCSFAGQSWHSVICGVKFARRWAHLLTACHTMHLISLSPSQATRLLRLLVGALVAYLYACLLLSGCLPVPPAACRIFSGSCLPAPPAAYPNFSGCLLGRPTACRTPRLPASFSGCLPGLKTACLPLGLLVLPGSSVASRDQLFIVACVSMPDCLVSWVVLSFFLFYLLSIAAAPALRACAPASPDELFLDHHPIMSEDVVFLCDGAENRLVQLVGMCV